MNFKGKGCKNKGITLIALVITIIVLLILAGVTIMMLMGSENSPQKASEAVEKDAIAGAKDEVAMEAQSALLDYFNKRYVERNDTDGASTQSEVAKAVGKAVDSAKSKNKQLLSDSGVTDNTITLKTKSYTVKGTIDENGGITWSDIVASTGGELDKEIDKIAELKIGDYVEYDVTYTDVYVDNVLYNAENGWRVLDPGEKDEETGMYKNVKIISTGIPAKLSYHETTNIGKRANGWWGTKEDVKEFFKDIENEIDSWRETDGKNSSYFAAAGLRKNFESIPLVHNTSATENQGCYTKINSEEGEIKGSIFKIEEKASEVHNLTLEELNKARNEDASNKSDVKDNDAATGLFFLGNYEDFGYYKEEGDSNAWSYWLANPSSDKKYLRDVRCGGGVDNGCRGGIANRR